MRLIIDLQACQGGNRHRGIGRYSIALAKAMAASAGTHEVGLLLNDIAPIAENEIREQFNPLIPPERIAVCRIPTGRTGPELDYTWRARAEEQIRLAFLKSLKPDMVHIASLFEDAYANSFVPPESAFPSAVTLYDLIPWKRSGTYLTDPRQKAWYERKLQSLLRADLLLAISEHTKREALEALHLPEEKIVNIGAAADSHFRPVKYSADFVAALREKFGLARLFVMYTGGIDMRKNMEGLLQAYALLPAHLRSRYQLAMVCAARPEQKAKLAQAAAKCGLQPGEVVFTGYVTEEELTALYNLCELFVFPSLHEGFGLPVLEAMACGAPAICSHNTSLPEVIGRADAQFDPEKPAAIAEKMHHALADAAFRQSLRDHAPAQAAKFSWAESAWRAWAAMENLSGRTKSRTIAAAQSTRSRPRLAFVSPLPPERTGIADYSAELLPALAEHYEIDLIVNQSAVSHPALDGRFRIHDVAWFEQNAHDFDRIVYQMGNSQYHRHMFELLRHHPGVVVLHDFYLGRVMEWMEDKQHVAKNLENQLRYSHGEKAVAHCKQVGRGAAADLYPCSKSVLDQAAGTIVHSRHAVDLARHWYGQEYTDEWTVIPQPKIMPLERDRAASRRKLGLPADDFFVVTFGFVSDIKDNYRLLTAWLSSTLAKNEHCHLVYVGENHGGKFGKKMLEAMAQSNTGGRISITGFATPEDFSAWMDAADVAVQLRKVTRGETSACALNCLAHGLPLIVNSVGSMAEFPEDAVYALPDEYETAQLANALETLRMDPTRRQRLAAAGVEFICLFHDPPSVALKYRDAIENYAFQSRQSCYRKLIFDVAEITEMQPDEDDVLVVAASIAANHPHRGTCRNVDDTVQPSRGK